MDVSDIIGWVLVIVFLIGISYFLYVMIPVTYNEIRSYNIMQDECNVNPDICFCDRGSCSIKSSCGYTKINDGSTIGGCNHTKICEIVTKANWKEGIWEYDC